MTRKSPAFAGRAFLFRVVYVDIIDASNNKEKHDHTVSLGRNRTGIVSAQAGNRGGYWAWIEWAKRLINRLTTKNPSVMGSGGVGFQRGLKSGKRTERRQPFWLHLIRIAGEYQVAVHGFLLLVRQRLDINFNCANYFVIIFHIKLLNLNHTFKNAQLRFNNLAKALK
jgi:hypothetical protein